MNTKQPAIYILTNKRNGTLYVGVTSNLAQRVFQHKNGLINGFRKYYDCNILVYYEYFEKMTDAITREKQIKSRVREYKITLIELKNFEWKDLSKYE